MSGLNISIDESCFDATTDGAYDDLRALKVAATKKLNVIVRTYETLKMIADDDDLEHLEASTQKWEYNEARVDFMVNLERWYQKSGKTIRERPGNRPTMKVRNTHAYMRKVKRVLRKTTMLGEQEEDEEDKEWLEEEREEFPQEIIPTEVLQQWKRDRKDVKKVSLSREVQSLMQKSTPEAEEEEGKGMKEAEEVKLPKITF